MGAAPPTYFGMFRVQILRGRDRLNETCPFSFGASMAQHNSFVQQVVVSATAQQLAANQVFDSITLAAKASNTGVVYIGFSSGVTSSNGYALDKGLSVKLRIADASQIWIVGTASDVFSAIGS
jgi:hypothetical protein